MCLHVDSDNPKDKSIFRFDKDGYTYCWKNYRLNDYKPVLTCLWWGEKSIKPGWIKSDRRTTRVPISTDYIECKDLHVNRGIHVYTRKSYVNRLYAVVRVRCHRDDLVANSYGEAVFTKVFLEEKEYNKVIGV